MENTKGPTSTHTKSTENRNDNKENKLHSLKEVPKRGFVQIKESFRTFKKANWQPVYVKEDKCGAIRFMGDGVSFKAKLIGILEVSEARGDRMCQEALFDLKMAIRAAGEHKQRITINVAIDGLKLRDEKTGDCLYHHPIHKISFIAQDMVDSRAFGYIFGSPDTGHRFFGIKTDKAASQVVITMRDLFQTVFELKKQEIEMTRQQQIMKGSGLYLEALASTASKVDHVSCNDDGSKRFNRDLSSMDKSEFKNTTPNANDLLNLELELNNLQQGLSQMESITPPSADPFGDSFTVIPTVALTKLPPPPSTGERRTRNSSATSSSGVPEKHWFDKETESIFSMTNPSEVRQSLQASDYKVIESTNHTSPTIKSDAFDVFTELDPLGTGRSKPYVDKKDFFQELKNPPKKILNQLAAYENEKIPEQQSQSLATKTVSDSFSSDLSFKDTSGLIEDPFKNDNFNKSHSNSVEMEFADFSSFESLKPVSPQLQHKSPLLKSDSSSSQNSAQGLLKVSLPSETQKPYNISTSPKYNLMTKNRSKIKMRKSPSPDYYRNDDPTSPDDDYAIMKLMTLPQRIDIAPEPPPRPSSSLDPPPLPPKKQQIPSKAVKPIRTRNCHYDYIENYVSSYNLPSTQLENEAPPLPLPSRKPKSDIKKKKEEVDSEYYLVPVSVRKTSSELKSNISTSLDITLSQLTKTGFSDLADTLRISPTSLSKMTLKELTLRLSKLTINSNEDTQTIPKKTEEDKKEPEKSLYDKYAVFRELLDEEKTSETVVTENDKYAALRDIPIKEPMYEEESSENFPIEEIVKSNQNINISEQNENEINNEQVFEPEDEKNIDQIIETKENIEVDEDDEDDDVQGDEEEEDEYEEENCAIKNEDIKGATECEVTKEEVATAIINPEPIENNTCQQLFDNAQWATFDAEPEIIKNPNSPWAADNQEPPTTKPKVNLKKVPSNRSKCSSSWDDCEESEDNWDAAKRSLESSIEDFPRTVNGWSDGESMYEDEPYYERKPNRRSNRKISPRHREPSPWDEGTRYNDEWESPYMIPHWRVPHMDDERRRSSKDDKRRVYSRPDIERRVQKLPSTPNWEDEKYQRLMYERRRRFLEEQYNWDRFGPPIPKGFKNYSRPPPPIDNSDDEDVKMRYRLPKKNRYVSSTTPRKPRRSYHRRSDGSDEDHNIPPRKPYSQEELDLSESELEQNWSRRSKNKWSLKRNQTSPFDDNFTAGSPDSSLFTKTMSTCSDLGYLTKPSPSTSSKTNRNVRKPKRSDSGHRSIDSNSKTEGTKRSPFEDDFTPENTAKGSMSSEFSFKDDDVFVAKDIKIPQEEVSNSPKEMKKSESINIFSRNSDPFEDDDFFNQEVSSKPNLASLEEAISDREGDEWNKKPDRTKNE
ncbi:uncharacterized protein LOC114128637 isoform X2 [Aphis gossypii]|uniref:uncharacterized protein LOC114128637 isoform X2 n=1 Tax=Aphis gossypii TaxID=80765 RepID=UPI002159720E|nr:uncharacterized protein LOC114128637 isoform X2 [Aphis gossypii]